AVSPPALGATGGADEQVKLPIQLPQHLVGTQPQSAGRQGQTAVPGGIAVAIVELATAQADGRVGLPRTVRTPLDSQLQSRGAGLTDVDVLPLLEGRVARRDIAVRGSSDALAVDVVP